MIFSEWHSCYYDIIAEILRTAVSGECSEQTIREIVARRGFAESALTILPALKNERWQLLRRDLTTPIRHAPTMPPTDLEKQWLKAISLDARIRLFDIRWEGLSDVEPLFTEEDIFVFDRYADGDPYEDEAYRKHFSTVSACIRRNEPMDISFVDRKGGRVRICARPTRLEYSERDDKFRVLLVGSSRCSTVNLARICECSPHRDGRPVGTWTRRKKQDTAVLRVKNERNAPERVMLHFSHFEKQAERCDANTYLLRIVYDVEDMSEMVIRILAFGPMVEVIGSARLRAAVIRKLKDQCGCGLF